MSQALLGKSWLYGSMPYVGMAPKKMVATSKVTNDTLEISALE